MTIYLFLLKVITISLSGVMAPGPVTTAAITYGTRNRHVGALIALGHGVIEFPLMFAIMAGMGIIFENDIVKITIGLIGGMFLVWMGIDMLRSLKTVAQEKSITSKNGPLLTGIILTATNPYFLLWWATVGLALATDALQLGMLAFALFALVHWLCDLIWLEALTWTSFQGSKLISEKTLKRFLVVCALAILFFGGTFIFKATRDY